MSCCSYHLGLFTAIFSVQLHLSYSSTRSMFFPMRHLVSCLGLLAFRCQAFVVQPASASFSNQQQITVDNHQHKPLAAIRGFGVSLQEGARIATGCSSLLPARSSPGRGSKLRSGSPTSMSLGERVNSRCSLRNLLIQQQHAQHACFEGSETKFWVAGATAFYLSHFAAALQLKAAYGTPLP